VDISRMTEGRHVTGLQESLYNRVDLSNRVAL
jgi:hypothetical protein